MLQQAQQQGLTALEVDALRLYLTDRAAQMDGATRLEMAARLLPEDERAPIDTFVGEMGTIRNAVIARGADDLNSLSNDEWERLTNGDK